jgi:hypothetical protein
MILARRIGADQTTGADVVATIWRNRLYARVAYRERHRLHVALPWDLQLDATSRPGSRTLTLKLGRLELVAVPWSTRTNEKRTSSLDTNATIGQRWGWGKLWTGHQADTRSVLLEVVVGHPVVGASWTLQDPVPHTTRDLLWLFLQNAYRHLEHERRTLELAIPLGARPVWRHVHKDLFSVQGVALVLADQPGVLSAKVSELEAARWNLGWDRAHRQRMALLDGLGSGTSVQRVLFVDALDNECFPVCRVGKAA